MSDYPSDYLESNNYMLIIDFQCKVVKNRVIHKYYEKSMNTKFCIFEKSAFSARTKYTTLVQETAGRSRNCSSQILKIKSARNGSSKLGGQAIMEGLDSKY
jgi:hypothetical protein